MVLLYNSNRHKTMLLSRVVRSLALTLLVPAVAYAQATLRAGPSTHAVAEVTLNYPQGQGPAGAKPMMIRLDYGQPHLRGRTLHTDSLVPYDKPWRLGANAATRLVTDVDLVLGGTTLAKGTYVLFAVPGRAGWKLIVQKNGPEPEVTYDAANDIATIALKRRELSEPVESLSMWLIPAPGTGAPHGELRISWGTFAVSTDWTVK
ncbi:MAG: DUF2911 domain-containing protein [Gemmatimonadales bacterium]